MSRVHLRIIALAVVATLALSACSSSEESAAGVATLANEPAPTASPPPAATTAPTTTTSTDTDPDAAEDTATDDTAAEGNAADDTAADATPPDAAAAESTAPTEFANDEEQLIAFSQCMRDEGIDMADPTVDADGNVQMPVPRGFTPGGGTPLPDGIEEAAEACQEFLEGIDTGFGGNDLTELQDGLIEFTGCMRDNGFDMPDIDLSQGIAAAQRTGASIDQSDPDWIAAFEVCGDILAGFGPGQNQGGE